MSRAALAELVGASLQIVEDLERGYPIPRDTVSAVCRTLEISEPPPDPSPSVQLALLLRERRGRARLSRPQLAARAGLTSPIIRSIETATLRPSQEICMALLAVKVLQLQESDVAAFINLPSADADRGASGSAETISLSAAEKGPNERAGPSKLNQGRRVLSRGAGSVRDSRGQPSPKVVATVLVRFYDNGKVSLEMRPLRPKTRREAATSEFPGGALRSARVPSER